MNTGYICDRMKPGTQIPGRNPHMIPADTLVTYNLYRNIPENVTPACSDELIDSIPLYSYTFNPDIYRTSILSLPSNILRTVPETQGGHAKDISVPYHMPHWKYSEFTPAQQRDFVAKYFPDRMNLYKRFSNDKERTHLFIYLWMYMNGGVYVSPNYELLKPLDSLLDNVPAADLYFTFDSERHISSEFFASQPFCGFWLEVVDLMDKKKKLSRDGLLTKATETTKHKFEIIPRNQVDPYNACDTEYNKESYLCPMNKSQDFITYVACQTGNSTEVLYLTAAIILILVLLFVSALLTN